MAGSERPRQLSDATWENRQRCSASPPPVWLQPLSLISTTPANCSVPTPFSWPSFDTGEGECAGGEVVAGNKEGERRALDAEGENSWFKWCVQKVNTVQRLVKHFFCLFGVKHYKSSLQTKHIIRTESKQRQCFMMQRGKTTSIPLKPAFHFNINKVSLKRRWKKIKLMHITAEYQASIFPLTQQYRQKWGLAVIQPSL